MDKCLASRAGLLALTAAAICGAAHVASAGTKDWSGTYLGANLGLATENSDTKSRSLHLGVDRHVGDGLVGAEIEYTRSPIATQVQPIDNIARLKLKAGYGLRNTYLYGVAGLARARGGFGASNGYLFGIGAEHPLSEKISIGGEILHHQFDNFARTGSDLDVNVLAVRLNYRF